MARKKCNRGHVYDHEIYGDNCPFCPSGEGSTVCNGESSGTDCIETGGNRTFVMDNDRPTEAMDNVGGGAPFGGGATVIRPAGVGGGVSGGRKIVGLLATYSANPLGEVFHLYEGKNYIGRAVRECDICIGSDARVSNRHVSVLFRTVDGKFKFKDEQSSNGTFVNGELVDEGELKNFDVLRIGDTVLCFIAIPRVD